MSESVIVTEIPCRRIVSKGVNIEGIGTVPLARVRLLTEKEKQEYAKSVASENSVFDSLFSWARPRPLRIQKSVEEGNPENACFDSLFPVL